MRKQSSTKAACLVGLILFCAQTNEAQAALADILGAGLVVTLISNLHKHEGLHGFHLGPHHHSHYHLRHQLVEEEPAHAEYEVQDAKHGHGSSADDKVAKIIEARLNDKALASADLLLDCCRARRFRLVEEPVDTSAIGKQDTIYIPASSELNVALDYGDLADADDLHPVYSMW